MFDPKCLELAKHFLEDEPLELKNDQGFAESLAQEVQMCIEDSIELRKSEIMTERRKAQEQS